ncbi:class I SAM-dependent methyltransferase [Mycobacterium talmoniae]|uniref:S-adenosyl-L-methionine-dependent methyltransferase n=1 Tax=Mycobacterium talmoniae TaxID=1858794 RepID=A0A1S1NLR0_9MYCO|nr:MULTISPECIES: class I SAM-dependent methyltransferase [Mycobacterium]OHV05567.1 SAM-dependent methyltransferase [Mycobacterium talmoniae]TDH55466.1 class I SAM-dependent methyltransferase [Mycobacterium eburneum]
MAASWARSEHDDWDIVSSVGYTALVVAGWRALHAASPEPLVTDDYARLFIAAAADRYLTGLLANPASSDNATVFPRLYGVQTRFFDDFFGSAAGVRQAVIVAAGLDSRAYRLDWPAHTTVFEVDQPKVLEFKAGVLAQHGAAPRCQRRAVAADLRDDWSAPLTAAGFDPRQPAAWSVEGLLPYLTGPAQDALFGRIGELSAPGSRLAVGALGSGSDWGRLAALNERYPGLTSASEVDFSALTYPRDARAEPAAWLAEHGWTVEQVTTSPQLQTRYGRTPLDVDVQVDRVLHSEYITAVRRG